MDFKEKHSTPNPREKASLLSRLLFLWIVPLFRKGLKNESLILDDMYDVPEEDISHKLGVRLGNEWEKERKCAGKKAVQPSFFKALVAVFGKLYLLLGLAVLFDECVISDQSVSESEQYFYGLGVCLTSLLHAVIIHPLSFEILHIGMKYRISACSLIYRKTILLSRAAQEDTTIGNLINLISNDVAKFDMNLLFIPYLIIGPIQTVIFTYFLWEELGISCLSGVGFVFLLMPIQYYIGMLSRNLRFKIAQKSDERNRLMNEIIVAIRVIKMYAWELPFSSLINQVRKEEVKVIQKRAYLKSFYLSLFLSSKKFIPYLAFLTYVSVGHTLTADKVFFAVTIFDIIIANMVSTLPSAAAGCGELVVAVKRIESFLLLEEKTVNNAKLDIRQENGESEVVPSIKMHNLTASWTGDKNNLDKLNVNFTGDKLVMIVGPVGCGKSSFLQALLGELPISSGKCYIKGKITYSGQDPYIFSGTLRQNILFGKDYNENLYEDIISVCSLDSDFRQFPLGERGITLSGGQKARVNLARALYRQSSIYLLDDPLSSVDSKVSRHIFDKCIKQYLAGNLRILVTHQLQYMPKADHIIVMNKGHVIAQGTYQELVEEGIDFLKLITSEVEPDLYRKASLTKLEAIEQELKKEEEVRDSQEEKMTVGCVSLKTYWQYFRSGNSIAGMILVFTGFLVSQLLYTASDYWLSHWTNEEEAWSISTKLNFSGLENSSNSSERISEVSVGLDEALDASQRWTTTYLGQHVYIAVYSGLVLLIALHTNINSAYFFKYCMKISSNIHDRMFASVVRAPMQFFDDNPSGRIMNRFVLMSVLDESLPAACYDVITIFLIMLGVIIVVILSNYYIFIPSTFLLISLMLIRRFYIQTARQVKRLEIISRSPLFTHLTATIQGLTSIRALNAQPILTQQFDGLQDIHSAAWFLFISSNRFFGVWLELMSCAFLTFVTFSFMLFSSSTKSGFVGLAISSVLSVTFKFQWGMRQSAELENLMTVTQRCLEYIQLKHEPSLESHPKNQPQSNWPKSGEIIFNNISLSYYGKEVLRGISFKIQAKEKVGIVGRTGAGKSSIIAALFRMTEPVGEIFIDGVNVGEIGLHDLRKRISIIPQDPVLFCSTVRYNLDPFEQFQDQDLWQVLEEVGLKEYVTALDMKVADNGINFSVGQRQLVCLARAILRKNKIIVLDEATANVDYK
ncbi:Multidrug resistance-associated protein 4 [Folsomia candida]|uniref:Multidrug resistance-associated protein 4 n=1 Tax=Folsomia candida TaxID=158441 RepID=A0A226ET45_FOLCA|nr:Multidrug resistance-associated protein 4 [Folsomia candida]